MERKRLSRPATLTQRSSSAPAVGKVTRTQRLTAQLTAEQRADRQRRVQLSRDAHTGLDDHDVTATAAHGISGGGSQLPYLDQIQAAFGAHELADVRAHVGGPAADASAELGAHAYATGNDVAFASQPSLFLAAHETAHVVQQRSGVHLTSAVGHAGDPYEQQADAVAARVVAGESAEELLGLVRSGGSTGVQRKEDAVPPPREVDEHRAISLVTSAHQVSTGFEEAHKMSKSIYKSGNDQANALAGSEANHEAYAAAQDAHSKPLDKSTLATVVGVIVDIASFATGAAEFVEAAKAASAAVRSVQGIAKAGEGLRKNKRALKVLAAKEDAIGKSAEAVMGVAGGVGAANDLHESKEGEDATEPGDRSARPRAVPATCGHRCNLASSAVSSAP